jgi:hypothetical protein
MNGNYKKYLKQMVTLFADKTDEQTLKIGKYIVRFKDAKHKADEDYVGATWADSLLDMIAEKVIGISIYVYGINKRPTEISIYSNLLLIYPDSDPEDIRQFLSALDSVTSYDNLVQDSMHEVDYRLLDVYSERNRVVQALGRMAKQIGYNVGIKDDKEDKQYVILYIDLPTGQVSWHIPRKEIVGKFPQYSGDWDKHDTKSKVKRVVKYIKQGEVMYNEITGNKVKCVICGRILHKDQNTKELERSFTELWKDKNGRLGLDNPKHYHTTRW